MVKVTPPDWSMRMKALGMNVWSSALSAARLDRPVANAINRPPPNAAVACRKPRRERFAPGALCTCSSIRSKIMSGTFALVGRQLRGAFDSPTDARIGPAATDVSGHRGIDIGIRRLGMLGEQRGCGHDLPRLAVTALRNVQLDP